MESDFHIDQGWLSRRECMNYPVLQALRGWEMAIKISGFYDLGYIAISNKWVVFHNEAKH